MSAFKTHNADGAPKTCKFCHAPVWWSVDANRWYNPGGTEFHACALKTEHHKNEGYRKQEARRNP